MIDRKAFTMIELIFIIVIIGILASIAIPRLAASRDDAVHSVLLADTKTCINDLISGYKGQGNTLNINSVPSCSKAISEGANISYTSDSVRVLSVDPVIDGDYVFMGSKISI